MSASHPAPASRCIAAATAAALVAVQGFAAAHFALVEHSVCPEHGELTHGPNPGALDHGPVGLTSNELPEHDAEHELCTVLVRPRDDVAQAWTAALAPPPAPRPGAGAPPARVFLGHLHIAPKTSPPCA